MPYSVTGISLIFKVDTFFTPNNITVTTEPLNIATNATILGNIYGFDLMDAYTRSGNTIEAVEGEKVLVINAYVPFDDKNPSRIFIPLTPGVNVQELHGYNE